MSHSRVRTHSETHSKYYRANVGIVLCNANGKVLVAHRVKQGGWQFPQGGIDRNETPVEAAYRELNEELGLESRHVRLIKVTDSWFWYDIPQEFRKNNKLRGQKQKWVLFQFIGSESDFCLDCTPHPEFDDWKWEEYWNPAGQVIEFKREVYLEMLAELEEYVPQMRAK